MITIKAILVELHVAIVVNAVCQGVVVNVEARQKRAHGPKHGLIGRSSFGHGSEGNFDMFPCTGELGPAKGPKECVQMQGGEMEPKGSEGVIVIGLHHRC